MHMQHQHFVTESGISLLSETGWKKAKAGQTSKPGSSLATASSTNLTHIMGTMSHMMGGTSACRPVLQHDSLHAHPAQDSMLDCSLQVPPHFVLNCA